jgi:hypothetical protein
MLARGAPFIARLRAFGKLIGDHVVTEAIDLPASLTGFEFVFADDSLHKLLFVEINHGETFVARVTAENYPSSFDVEWPVKPTRPQCRKIDYDKLMEALAFGQRMLALRLVGTAQQS